MKTAERETPNRRPQCVANRADGAASQYRSCSIMWAAKQENFQPAEKCFFLTSPFIELTGFVANKQSKPLREKTQTAGHSMSQTDPMVRPVSTDPAQLCGLRSKKTSSRRRSVFS